MQWLILHPLFYKPVLYPIQFYKISNSYKSMCISESCINLAHTTEHLLLRKSQVNAILLE